VTPRVVVYTAAGCHLCDAALDVVQEVCGDEHAVVDIAADAGLEERYRPRIPVVEVDGEALFTYFVTADGLRDALRRR
jgi:hypothetical protein